MAQLDWARGGGTSKGEWSGPMEEGRQNHICISGNRFRLLEWWDGSENVRAEPGTLVGRLLRHPPEEEWIGLGHQFRRHGVSERSKAGEQPVGVMGRAGIEVQWDTTGECGRCWDTRFLDAVWRGVESWSLVSKWE